MQPAEGHASEVSVPDTKTPVYKWLAYLLEEHAMLGCIELSYRSTNAIGTNFKI